MIKIRLARHGRKNDPFYRIVAVPSRNKRDGQPLDIVGNWYPKKNKVEIDKVKLDHWVGNGAQLSPTVKKLIDA